jgi:restriction endonuclease Mrr
MSQQSLSHPWHLLSPRHPHLSPHHCQQWRQYLQNVPPLPINHLEERVAKLIGLTQSQLIEKLNDGKRYRFSYRLAWAKSELKMSGAIQKNNKGLWIKL